MTVAKSADQAAGAAAPPRGPEPWMPPQGADADYARFDKTRTTTVTDGTTLAWTLLEPARWDGPSQRDRVGEPSGSAPLVFANGWSCSDSYWTHIVPALMAAGHRCLLVDTRGHGASGLPRDPGRGARNLAPGDVSIKRLAADLMEVAEDAGLERAVVVGHSMGTQTALEAYRIAPDRVAGLVLVAGSYENPLTSFYGLPVADAAFPLVESLMATVPEVVQPLWRTIGPARFGHLAARAFRAAGMRSTAEDLHPYLLHLRSRDPAVMVRFAAAMRRHSAAGLLRHIEVPVLILAAGKDTFTPAAASTHMFEAIPTAEMAWFAEAAHTLPIEEPDAIVGHMTEWLDRRVSRALGT